MITPRVLDVFSGTLFGATLAYIVGLPLPPLVLFVMITGGLSMLFKRRAA